MAGEKYYKAERERQKKFLESEKALEENYKKVRKEESDFEYLNSLFREDSTREYNPVEHYKKGGINKPQKKIQKAYLGRAIRQPTETDNEFKIRHEYHTPFSDEYFKGPQKAQEGGLMNQPHLNYMGAAKGKFIAKGCGKVMSDRRKKTKMY